MSINPEGTSPKTEDSTVVLQRKFVDFLLNTIFNDRDAISVFPDGNAVKNGDSVQKLFQKLLGAAQSGIKYVESDTDAYGPNTVNTGDNSVIVGVDSVSDSDNTAKLAAGDSEIAVFEGEGFVQPYVTSVTPIEYDVPSSDGIAIKDNQMGFRLGGDTLYVDINDGKGSVRTLSLGAVPLGEYEQFLNDCGGLVYDLGQADRPVLDRKVLQTSASSWGTYDTSWQVTPRYKSIEIVCALTSDVGDTMLFGVGYERFALRINSGELKVNSNVPTGVTPQYDGVWRTYKLTFNLSSGDSEELFIDGVSVWSGSADLPSSGDDLLYVGGDQFGRGMGGKVAYCKITNPDDSVFAEWGMNGTGLDSSGNGRHLTLINNPSFVVDNTVGVRKVLSPVGGSDFVSYETSNFSPTDELGACTITSVVKVDSSTSAVVLHDYSTNTYNCVLVNGGFIKVNTFTSSVPYPVGQWMKIDVTYDVNGAVTSVFLDGVDVGITASAGGQANRSEIRMHIGGGNYAAQTKITLANGDIYAEWLMNGNALDSSGNGRDLTLVNNPQFTPSYELSTTDELDPINTIGYNKRMDFGKTDAITLSNRINITGVFTVRFKYYSNLVGYNAFLGTADASFFIRNYLRARFEVKIGGSIYNFNHAPPSSGDVVLSRDSGGVMTMTVDGIQLSDSYTDTSDFYIELLGTNFHIGHSQNIDGFVSDLNINNQHAYVGHGADASDWVDTIGSNDGIPSGGEEMIIPPDVAGNGLDALGNTLDVSGNAYPHPRKPVNSACRLFTGFEYITSGYIEGTETITSYVGTAVPTVSSGRVDFTSGWCARVTLSSGLVITLNNAGNSEISSDGNVVQYINAPSSSTQNDLHAELLEGYTRYIDTTDSNALRHVIYKDGRPLFTPVLPDGWVKAGEYPAIPQGHNEARTQFNFTHITETGNRPPEIEATGLDLQNYSFGDTLTNPFFKRTMASFNEDRHTMFPEALTGDCLTKANQHYSTN